MGIATDQAVKSYPLGESERELKRLEQQGAFLADLTEDVLRRAGIAPGMRVLDVGCGAGDVSLLAASLVGPTGAVLGIDRSTQAVELARRRAAAARRHWAHFDVAELDTFASDDRFDAVVGRLVLMYQPDPAALLRRLRAHLRPGGIVAFQEMAMALTRMVPEGPLFLRCRGWLLETFERAGLETDMGSKLFVTFLDAQLPAPQMIAAARVEGGAQSAAYEYMAATLRSLLPAIESLRVATAAEVDIDTVAERLRDEAVALRACLMPPTLIGAWARVPA